MPTQSSDASNVRQPGQQSPSLHISKSQRTRPAQTLTAPNGQEVQRSHKHHSSVTFDPTSYQQPQSQESQRVEADPGYWQVEQYSDSYAVGSPPTFRESLDLFNFDEDQDFLTTEASSENLHSEHTTPQELIWEQQFQQPHIVGENYHSSPYAASQPVERMSDLQGLAHETEQPLQKFISPDEILGRSHSASSSHSRNTPTNSIHPDLTMSAPSADPASQRKNLNQSLKVSTAPNSAPQTRPRNNTLQPGTLIARPISPVVMISSYESTEFPGLSARLGLSSTKRSRGSDSSGEDNYNDNTTEGSESRNDEMSSTHLMPPDAIEAEGTRSGYSQRTGFEPAQRSEDMTLSLKDIEEKRQRDERNADVHTWLATSEAGSDVEDDTAFNGVRRRPRASTTTGAKVDLLGRVYSDNHIPGPGALVDVDSDEEYFDDVSDTSSIREAVTKDALQQYHDVATPAPPETLERQLSPEQMSFPTLDESIPPEMQEPSPRQFIRRSPLHDPSKPPPNGSSRVQPESSNAAAQKFRDEAAKWETSSRAATWGTRRRLSESEVLSIVEGSAVRHLSLSKRGRERGNSLLKKARGLLPRRSSSNIRGQAEPTVEEKKKTLENVTAPTYSPRESISSIKPAQRISSFGKPKSPQLSASSAFIAMTGSLAAVGRGKEQEPIPEPPKSPRLRGLLRKPRSKSDVGKPAKGSKPGLAEMWTKAGGPPMPTLASPMHERESILAAQIIDNEDAHVEDDDDDQTDEVAIRMDLEVRAEDIIPTLEGFKDHARRLNPRLEPFLIDRIGQEQLRRYKKLAEQKVKHTKAVIINGKCSSGKHCFDLGGEATILPPRVSAKDPDSTATQFQVSNLGDNELDESFTEGVVTPALFPPGIPLPKVKRLPAEFECHLCFKVKKFQKPSDWTKHVHEDVQPFSCTFPNCTESKSFKRKADWVRHENERHRHLEWWQCNISECNHVCYRKDNFVQHLVREHKMTEPKVKSRGSSSSKNKPVNPSGYPEDSEIWRLVDGCRFETTKKPKDEPCRFCGNVCSSFKKLSVHMGKHMEQIAMPVLQLVALKMVNENTTISPIEQVATMPPTFPSVAQVTNNNLDPSNLSPYPASATSAYQNSSAGQSPVSIHARPQNTYYDPNFHSPHSMTPVMQGQGLTGPYASTQSYSGQSYGYSNHMHQAESFIPYNDTTQYSAHTLSPQNQLVAPRSQPMVTGFADTYTESAQGDYTQAQIYPIYTSAGTTQGYIPQYTSPLMQTPGTNSPMAHNGRSGLGLQSPNQQQYGYGAPGTSPTGRNVQY